MAMAVRRSRMVQRGAPAAAELREISARTVEHYRRMADAYRDGTWDHDVRQNVEALLEAIARPPPLRILDLGCGPGRDLLAFRERGHEAIGLDACPEFVAMAAAASGVEVWQQDLVDLRLPAGHFDGIFANAVLFHVPGGALAPVLGELHGALRPGGVLLSSNPHGQDEEGWAGDRYACFWHPSTWRRLLVAAGFTLIGQYFRPPGLPRRRQPWHVSLWRTGT